MPTPAIVQTFTKGGGPTFPTGISIASGSNITSGNVLVAVFYQGEQANLATNPSGCVTWSQAATSSVWGGGAATGTISMGPITSSGACTVSLAATGGGVTDLAIAVFEASGITTTVDGTPGFSIINSGGTYDGPSTTTTSNGDLVLAVNMFNSAPVTMNSPFTSFANSATMFSGVSAYVGGDLSYDVQGTAGVIHPSYTATSASQNMAIIALKASSGGSGPTIDQLMSPNDVGSNLLVIPHSVVAGY
jgi:hypothetical protein